MCTWGPGVDGPWPERYSRATKVKEAETKARLTQAENALTNAESDAGKDAVNKTMHEAEVARLKTKLAELEKKSK